MKVGDLVCHKRDNRVVYKIEEITYSDWSKDFSVILSVFHKTRKDLIVTAIHFYMDDVRLVTPERIALAIAGKMLE